MTRDRRRLQCDLRKGRLPGLMRIVPPHKVRKNSDFLMFRFLYRLFLAISLTVAVAVVALRIAAMNREVVSANELLLPESRVVETVHGNIHALEVGPEDGVPVLLIHGSVGWSGLWRDTLTFLSEQGYRAIAIDLPPMGLSDRLEGMDYSRQSQGLRILAVAEALDVRPVIVAHSFGAGAAVEALMASSGEVTGAVIVAGALGLGQDGAGKELPLPLRSDVVREAAMSATVTNPYATKLLVQQFVHKKDRITSEIVTLLEYPFRRDSTTEALADWLPTLLVPPRGAVSSDPAQYGRIGVPVTLIWGREDTVTPPVQGEVLSNALGGATVFWMDDTGHIPQIEDPVTFHQLLADALAQISQG